MTAESQGASRPQHLQGAFRHLLFSPRGAIEGLMLDTVHGLVQVAFDAHDPETASAFGNLEDGAPLTLDVTPEKRGTKAAHAVYVLDHLPGDVQAETFKGVVARIHYARHGEPNGVVLDSGDFLHLKPDGMEGRKIAVGETVTATGVAHPLATGGGWVVDVTTFEGKSLRTKGH